MEILISLHRQKEAFGEEVTFLWSERMYLVIESQLESTVCKFCRLRFPADSVASFILEIPFLGAIPILKKLD